MVQVVLSILKPAGSVGATVQLTIAPAELPTFNNSGGAIASCTAAPTLPAGLSINSTTCTISGTPTEVRARTVYTVTAKNATDNTDSASFSLTVNAPAPNLTPPELLKVMLVMAKPIIAIWSAPVAFVRLGAGAFTVKEKTALSVLSAKNATDNTDSAVFSLTVNAPAPNLTNATGADQIAIIGFAITNITFGNSGGAIASCTVTPS
jgi:hypothetical protein